MEVVALGAIREIEKQQLELRVVRRRAKNGEVLVLTAAKTEAKKGKNDKAPAAAPKKLTLGEARAPGCQEPALRMVVSPPAASGARWNFPRVGPWSAGNTLCRGCLSSAPGAAPRSQPDGFPPSSSSGSEQGVRLRVPRGRRRLHGRRRPGRHLHVDAYGHELPVRERRDYARGN